MTTCGALLGALLGALCCSAAHAQTAASQKFSFAALADAPYSPQEIGELDALVSTINARRPDLTLYVGDITGGAITPRCGDEMFARMRRTFDSFDSPLVYTPGDNEWQDCPGANFHDVLRTLRQSFYPDNHTMGGVRLPVQRQDGFPENATFNFKGVRFVTNHIVARGDNLRWSLPRIEEFRQRSSATAAWLREAFRQARQEDAKALVIAAHSAQWADPVLPTTLGFDQWLGVLRDELKTFTRPVLLGQRRRSPLHNRKAPANIRWPCHPEFHAPGGVRFARHSCRHGNGRHERSGCFRLRSIAPAVLAAGRRRRLSSCDLVHG